jgi:hypothetical protein
LLVSASEEFKPHGCIGRFGRAQRTGKRVFPTTPAAGARVAGIERGRTIIGFKRVAAATAGDLGCAKPTPE